MKKLLTLFSGLVLLAGQLSAQCCNVSYGTGSTNSNNGYYNASFGDGAQVNNSDAYACTAVGYQSLYHNNSEYNTAIGYQSLYSNTNGYFNFAGGAQSLYGNTTGSYNTASGLYALYNNTTGSINTAAGLYALYNTTTGSDNVGIGYGAQPNAGNYSNTISIGTLATANASNTTIIGNSSMTSIGGYANWTNFSDGRYKKNIQKNVPGLAFINRLTPVTYTLDIDGIEAKLHPTSFPAGDKGKIAPGYKDDPTLQQAMRQKAAIVYTGFIAQDVEKVADSIGYDFSGIDKPGDPSQSFYGLRYGDFVVPMVKALQELSAGSNSKDSAINALQQTVDSLKTQITEIRALLQKNAAAFSGASLEQNAPNPFNGTTTIGYSLPAGTGAAQMQITDISGRVIAVFALPAGGGKNTLTANVSGYAAGTYYYSLVINGRIVNTRQMTSLH
jgi:hypothetical protein